MSLAKTAWESFHLPVFGSIDRSAWVSGLCFLSGLIIADIRVVEAKLLSGSLEPMVTAAAIVVFFASILLIQRHMRFSLTANTYGKPQHLVTSGVFGYSRNPIYVAFLLPLASLAGFSIVAAAAAIALYLLVMTIYVIRHEEHDLRSAFAAEFDAYAARTPMWL